MIEKILVYVEIQGNVISPASIEILSGAQELAQENTEIIAVGSFPGNESAIETVSKYADKIILFSDSDNNGYTPDGHAKKLIAIVKKEQPNLMLIANTYVGIDLAPYVAMACDRSITSYCSRVEIKDDQLWAKSILYGGKVVSNTQCNLPTVLAVNPGAFTATEGQRQGTVENIDEPVDANNKVIELMEPDAGDVDITSLERLVCVGRGIGDEDQVETAKNLAEALSAQVVASRPLVDMGWLDKNLQVGKSGKTVKAKLYLAIGVSGAPEHIEGMQGCETIIAVNTDEQAPIFEVAHYGITADSIEFMDTLIERLT